MTDLLGYEKQDVLAKETGSPVRADAAVCVQTVLLVSMAMSPAF
jgi:hypothetical protein